MSTSARAMLLMGVMLMVAHEAGALEHEFIELPERMHPTVRGVPVDDLRERYRAGDEDAAALVERVLERAAAWRGIDDQWWLDRVLPVTPLGMWTTACPFHPERCQDFSDVRWEWSLDEPFRLTCPLCEEEGREYAYYPNPDYPDDGTGCYPTDEVWRRTHSPEWGREHPGIPWDHWDGRTHGYSDGNYAYFFRGKWHHMAHMRIANSVLPTLGEAWQICAHVLPEDDPRADDAPLFARAAASGLLTLARAHLGDGYLADIVGGDERYAAALADFYRVPPEPGRFEGYVPYSLEDGIMGNPEHPEHRTRADIYCDGSQFGDAYATGWLRAFALIRDSYADSQVASGLLRATECLLVAHADDAGRLDAAGGEYDLKYGKLDYHLRPYSMLARGNLDGRLLDSQFQLGVLFGDTRIIDATLRNYELYLHNTLYGDGLSWEGSPAYTNVTWNQLSRFYFAAAEGYRGHLGPDHPWWDERVGGLNLYAAQELAKSVAKEPRSCLPNGRQIAWEDSHAAARPQLEHLEGAVRAGAAIPDDCAELFDVAGEPGRETVQMRDPAGFPSALLHNNRKIVLRMPREASTDVLALDYGWAVGHWHYAPLTIMWYTRDQEVLTDLGYMGAMHRLTREWIKRCPSHNCCVIRDADGAHAVTRQLRGDSTGLMAHAGWVQVAEAAEQLPINLAELGDAAVYGRTVAQIAAGEDASYVVDIFRARGGASHEWYLHADGDALTVEGCEMQRLEPEVTLAEHLALPGGSDTVAWRHIDRLRAGSTDGGWSAVWAPLRTYDSGERRVREELGYRCTMLPGGETELVAGIAPGQRYTDNRDLNVTLPVLCARRANAEDVDVFVALHETIDGEPTIRDAQRLPAPEDIVALRVDRGEAIDYVIARRWDAPAGALQADTPDGELRCTARFAALTVEDGAVTRAFVAGEGAASLGAFELTCGPAPSGRLVALDDDADMLLIDADGPWPEGGALSGRWGVIRHPHGTSTFTVGDVEQLGDGQVRVSLRYTPHLALNRVQATGVEDGRLLVEPQPAHPFSVGPGTPADRGFAVFRLTAGAPAGAPERLGGLTDIGSVRVSDNWGKNLGPALPTLSIDGDITGVQPGDELAITRLRPGSDRVEVLPIATLR